MTVFTVDLAKECEALWRCAYQMLCTVTFKFKTAQHKYGFRRLRLTQLYSETPGLCVSCLILVFKGTCVWRNYRSYCKEEYCNTWGILGGGRERASLYFVKHLSGINACFLPFPYHICIVPQHKWEGGEVGSDAGAPGVCSVWGAPGVEQWLVVSLLLRGWSSKVKTETPGVKNINRRRRKQSLRSEGFLLLGGFVGSLLRWRG